MCSVSVRVSGISVLLTLLALAACTAAPSSTTTSAQTATAAATASAAAPAASTAPTASTTAEALRFSCAAAQQLTDAGHPQLALDLIEKIRGPVPPQATTAAKECELERLNATTRLGTDQRAPAGGAATEEEPAAAVTYQKTWDGFVKSWVTPLQNPLLSWLGLVLALFVLARLFVSWPRMPFAGFPWKTNSIQLGRLFLFVGLVLILFSPVVMVHLLSTMSAAKNVPSGTADLLLLTVLAGVAGSFALCLWMASRLRVSVEARDGDGKVNEPSTNRIVALLGELGGTGPRGLEIPRGTDVTALSDSLTSTSFTNKVLAGMQKIIQLIAGVVPWRVVVTENASKELAVVITRNGWAAGAVTITGKNSDLFPAAPSADHGSAAVPKKADDADSASKPAKAETAVPDLQKLAAAFVLGTIAPHHQGFEGLCGATDWRSIGLHFIATTDVPASVAVPRLLLGRALDLDPQNLLAELALQNYLHRQATAASELDAYAEWLWRKHMELGAPPDAAGGGVEKLKRAEHASPLLRLRYSYLCVVLNSMAARNDYSASDDHRQVAHRLIGMLTQPPPECGALANRLRQKAALVCGDLGYSATPDSWVAQALVSPAPSTAYSAACHYARASRAADGPASDVKVQQSMDRLAYAFVDPRLKAWALKDPEFEHLRQSHERFSEFVGVPAVQPQTGF